MADSFAEALLKAGKITQTEIDQRKQAEKDKAQKEKDEKDNREKARLKEEDQKRKDYEKALQPFHDLWKNEKSHKFMAHIIFSFSPLSMGEYAWTREELKSQQCCICKCELMSKDHLFEKSKDIVEAGLNNMKSIFKEGSTIAHEKYKKSINKIIGGRTLGVVSPKTSVAFCSTCYEHFGNWVSNELIRGSREINAIIQKRMREIALEQAEQKEHDNAPVTDNRQDSGDSISGEVPGSQTEGTGRGEGSQVPESSKG